MPSWTVPDGIEPIRACRLWQVEPGTMSLRSIAHWITWSPHRSLRAICLAEPVRPATPSPPHGPVPGPLCLCGIWALADPADLTQVAFRPSLVAGVVKVWGRVVTATRGWRGEHAYPEALLRPQVVRSALLVGTVLDDGLLEALGTRYGIPILDTWPRLSPPARPPSGAA